MTLQTPKRRFFLHYFACLVVGVAGCTEVVPTYTEFDTPTNSLNDQDPTYVGNPYWPSNSVMPRYRRYIVDTAGQVLAAVEAVGADGSAYEGLVQAYTKYNFRMLIYTNTGKILSTLGYTRTNDLLNISNQTVYTMETNWIISSTSPVQAQGWTGFYAENPEGGGYYATNGEFNQTGIDFLLDYTNDGSEWFELNTSFETNGFQAVATTRYLVGIPEDIHPPLLLVNPPATLIDEFIPQAESGFNAGGNPNWANWDIGATPTAEYYEDKYGIVVGTTVATPTYPTDLPAPWPDLPTTAKLLQTGTGYYVLIDTDTAEVLTPMVYGDSTADFNADPEEMYNPYYLPTVWTLNQGLTGVYGEDGYDRGFVTTDLTVPTDASMYAFFDWRYHIWDDTGAFSTPAGISEAFPSTREEAGLPDKLEPPLIKVIP